MNWRNRDFLKLWGGQIVSELGTSVTQIALPTLAVLTLHAGPLQLGVLIALQRLPFLFLSMPIGVWIDKQPRRRVMIVADVGRMLALGSIPMAAVFGAVTYWQLYAVGLTTGVFTMLFDLAYLAYVPSLVGRDQLGDANAKLEGGRSVADIAGPAIGGILIQAIGAGRAIAADAASYLVSVISILWMAGADAAPTSGQLRGSLLQELRAGLAHVFQHPLLRSLILTTGGAIFAAHITDPNLYPFLYQILKLSPGTVGVILGVAGTGSIIGAVICRPVAARLGAGWTLTISGGLMGVLIALETTAQLGFAIPILVIVFFLLSLSDPIHNVTQQSLRQTLTPDHLQGRMNSVFRTVYWGGWPLGNLLGGYLGAVLGPVPAIWIGAAGFAIFSFATVLTPLRTAKA